MKKTLLLLSAALLAGSSFAAPGFQKVRTADTEKYAIGPKAGQSANGPQRVKANAEGDGQSMIWSYSGDPYTAYSLKAVTSNKAVYLAFKIPAAEVAQLAGCRITAINVTSGTSKSNKNLIKRVFPFISKDITTQEFDYSGALDMGTEEFTVNTHELSEPYELKEGSDLYIGYYFGYLSSMSGAYYIPTDGNPTTGDEEACLYGISTLSGYPSAFENISNEIGSLCLSITLEGDNLPQNVLSITDGSFPPYSKPGETVTYELNVWNRGAASVEDFVINTTFGSKSADVPFKLAPGQGIAPNSRGTIEVEAQCDETGIALPIKATITEVNGAENGSKANILESTINQYTEGYPHKILMEEATGTWCGWCPAGIVMMDYIKKNLADDYIIIAAHYSNNDPMQCDSYFPFMQTYVGGFPFAIFNRSYGITPSNASSDTDLYNYATSLAEMYRQYPAYANISLSGNVNEEEQVVEVTAKTNFLYDTEVPHYLSFAIVEDGISGRQENYYAGENVSMGGWENKASKVAFTYDDVARELVGFPGINNSLPAAISANTENEYSVSIPLKNVETKNFRVIGFIVSGIYGEVVNSVEVPFEWSSVNSIENEENAVRIENGAVVGGKDVKVFTLDGRRVANNGLANGLYIVVADGKASKVLVK